MPQFDPTYFLSQIIWLVISFGVLYIMVSNWLMPKVETALANRIANIEDNIKQAENTKKKAREIIDDYQKDIQQAKIYAQKIAQQEYQKAVEQAEQQKIKLKNTIEEKIKQEEHKIYTQNIKQEKDFLNEQVKLTKQIIENIVDLKVAEDEIKKIVKKTAREIHN